MYYALELLKFNLRARFMPYMVFTHTTTHEQTRTFIVCRKLYYKLLHLSLGKAATW